MARMIAIGEISRLLLYRGQARLALFLFHFHPPCLATSTLAKKTESIHRSCLLASDWTHADFSTWCAYRQAVARPCPTVS
jgi:hypothetical protein